MVGQSCSVHDRWGAEGSKRKETGQDTATVSLASFFQLNPSFHSATTSQQSVQNLNPSVASIIDEAMCQTSTGDDLVAWNPHVLLGNTHLSLLW